MATCNAEINAAEIEAYADAMVERLIAADVSSQHCPAMSASELLADLGIDHPEAADKVPDAPPMLQCRTCFYGADRAAGTAPQNCEAQNCEECGPLSGYPEWLPV